MIRNEIVFTDNNGKDHICCKAGHIVIVELDILEGEKFEDYMIRAVRYATSDSSVRPSDVHIKLCPNSAARIYKLDTPCGSYFAKPLGNCKVAVQVNEPIGPFGSSDYRVRAKQESTSITLFYLADANDHRVGPYHYLCW